MRKNLDGSTWRNAEGKPELDFHLHPGQAAAYHSKKRIVAVIAGVRAGKTSFGPIWLYNEMKSCGPGDYLVAAPSYPLLDKGAMPEIDALFGRLWNLGDNTARHFSISRTGHKKLWKNAPIERRRRIIYGHAQNPESLAAMTVKAGWLDEPGQKAFRLPSFEEIEARVSYNQGRLLLTSRPYDLGWLKSRVFDPWWEAKRAGVEHPDIDVFEFRSIDNPGFPKDEYYKAARTLPAWKFDMMYNGIFTRPAGLIYDRFDRKRHVVPRFRLPDEWPRYGGLDFGAVNTAAVMFAQEYSASTRLPTGRWFAYREYRPGKLPPETHAHKLQEGEPRVPTFVGGSHSEDEWRNRFRAAGLPVLEPPDGKVEVQIDALYQMIAEDRLIVMDDLVGLLDELGSYSRVLDDFGEPTNKIDEDQLYHLLASCRYFACWALKSGMLSGFRATVSPDRDATASVPSGVFQTETRKPDESGSSGRIGSGRMGGTSETSSFPAW